MAGAVDSHHPGVTEMRQAAVLLGIGAPGPTLLAVDQQGRAADPAPQLLDLGPAHAIGRVGAHVIIEFPAVGAVLVLVDPVLGQMARLLGREVPVGLLHPLQRVLDRGIAARQAPRKRTLLGDPFLHTLGDRHGRARRHLLRRRPEPFDGDEPAHRIGIDAAVADRDVAAERMRHDGHWRQFLLMDQLGQVVDIGGGRVIAVGRPLAVAVAAQIGGEDVPVMAQRLRQPIPVAAMVAPAMDEEERRRAGVAPVDIVQPQPLREIDPRGRAGARDIECRHGMPYEAPMRNCRWAI